VGLRDQITQAAQEIAKDMRTRLSDAGRRLMEERLLKFPVHAGATTFVPVAGSKKEDCHPSRKSRAAKSTMIFCVAACANTNFWPLMCKPCRHRVRYVVSCPQPGLRQ
jgi:hypothetical protein